MLEELFGPLRNLDAYIQASQLLQAEAVRALIEANRRRKWHCSGVLLWQLNEPWPNFCCTNQVDYFNQPKPAYYAAANAFLPEIVTARYDSLAGKPGEPFSTELWVDNSLEAARAVEVSWAIHDLAGALLKSWSGETLTHPNSVSRVGAVNWSVPADFLRPFLLRLTLHAGENCCN